MNATQRIILYKSFSALFLLFVIYGCQTTKSTVNMEQSTSSNKSDKTYPDVEKVEYIEDNYNTAEKKTDKSKEAAEIEKAHIEKFQNKFLGILGGHGGTVPQDANNAKAAESLEQTADDLKARPAKPKNRPFKELEKGLYGNWINDLETESYEFRDDGTVLIVVSGQRGMSQTLNGNYILVNKERIKFDFENDSFARQMPPRHYKITISDNEFALIDEPKKSDGPDGPTTKYKRIK